MTTTNTNKIAWERDEAYSCELTARLGDYAAVIVPPEYGDDGRWGIQIFDEADEEAMEYGETAARTVGLPSKEAARLAAEALLRLMASA